MSQTTEVYTQPQRVFAAGRSHRKRVFETVKTVNQTVRRRSVTPTSSNIPGSNQSLSSRTSPQSSGLSSPHSSNYGGDVSGDGVALDNRVQSILMESNQDRSGSTLLEFSLENPNSDVKFYFSAPAAAPTGGRKKPAAPRTCVWPYAACLCVDRTTSARDGSLRRRGTGDREDTGPSGSPWSTRAP